MSKPDGRGCGHKILIKWGGGGGEYSIYSTMGGQSQLADIVPPLNPPARIKTGHVPDLIEPRPLFTVT